MTKEEQEAFLKIPLGTINAKGRFKILKSFLSGSKETRIRFKHRDGYEEWQVSITNIASNLIKLQLSFTLRIDVNRPGHDASAEILPIRGKMNILNSRVFPFTVASAALGILANGEVNL